MKRLFDVLFSFLGLVVLSPIFIISVFFVKLNSKGSVFFKQIRVGKNNQDFKIFKFRTMYLDSDRLGLITVGQNDSRITKTGYYLRKYKLDELPQLINVFIGNMSFVGPRPEVRKYVNLYTQKQKEVLSVKPGITDLASIEFRNENEILVTQSNPDQFYIDVIMPKKLEINLNYLKQRSFLKDFKIIIKTIFIVLK
ncbi:MAG: sugar transferase [Flavobacteriaceae bacterium]|nr:sugar transferase [Flavobacteriaceae bacterium]